MIYIDPPFNTGRTQKSKTTEYKDNWGSVEDYIKWLAPRLRECHRLLKDTGVLCLHLDYRSVHYAKVELDKIFGRNNFKYQ